MEKTVVELFAGVGGFRVGLNNVTLKNNKVIEKNNWNFVWANQWEPATKTQDAFDCYIKRFGEKDSSNIDIFEVNKKNIPNHTLLVGGFPCQDYSVAQSLTTSKGIEGKKGVLWWAINDILKTKKPPFVLLENVDRLLISPAKQRGRDFAIILRSFLDNGYAVNWRVINAGEHSFPQRRRRIFIFAYHKSTKYYKEMKKLDNKDLIFKESIFAKQFKLTDEVLEENTYSINKKNYETLIDISNNFTGRFYNSGAMLKGDVCTIKVKAIEENKTPIKSILEETTDNKSLFLNKEQIKKFEYLKGSKRVPRIKPNGDPYFFSEGKMNFPEDLNEPSRTLLTSEGGTSRTTHVVKDIKTKKLRLLTPLECERLNGFPDNWTNTGMSNKRRNFMMGNALVVGVVNRLSKEILSIVKREE